jgi:hypothetical protein
MDVEPWFELRGHNILIEKHPEEKDGKAAEDWIEITSDQMSFQVAKNFRRRGTITCHTCANLYGERGKKCCPTACGIHKLV